MEWPDSADVVDLSSASGTSVADLEATIRVALTEPLGHPPLGASVVAGDQITIALEPGVPQAAAVASGITQYLVEAGHSPANVTILWQPTHAQDLGPTDEFLASYRDHVHFVRHDPDDASAMAYLAATRTAEPIYLNRALCDADFVLPVGVLRPSQALGNTGMLGGLFPTFSNRETLQRLRPLVGPSQAARQNRITAIANEVAWLLGIQFLVQIVPGPGDSIFEILAGNAAALRDAGTHRCEECWHHTLTHSADLVVVALSGGPSQQTWDNVARALCMATRAVNEQGAIVLATTLATRPGSALRRFGRWSEDEPLPKARKQAVEPDLIPAQVLLAARQRANIYLLSKLPQKVVEMIGMTYISEPEEILRLSRRHASCLVLGDAQYATLALDSLEPSS